MSTAPTITPLVIKDRAGEPVSGFANAMVGCQGPCLACCMPGQCLGALGCFKGNRAHVKFQVQGATAATLVPILAQASTVGNFDVVALSEAGMRARFYTPVLQWVDVVTLTLSDSDGNCEVDAKSQSAGIAPASCIGAPLCSILCCYIPFLDHGKNLLHIQNLEDLIKAGAEGSSSGYTIANKEVLLAGRKR